MIRQRAKRFEDGIATRTAKQININLPLPIAAELTARAKRDGVGVGRVAARIVMQALQAEQATPTPLPAHVEVAHA